MSSRVIALLVIAALVTTACVWRLEDDTVYPATIDDLQCWEEEGGTVTVRCTWTAVGDDVMVGRASRYRILRHDEEIKAGNQAQAVLVDDSLQPGEPDTGESYSMKGLEPDTGYWFAVSVSDDGGNTTLSNSVRVITLGPVIGFTVTPSTVPGEHAMDLSWTNPKDPDLERVLILRKVGAYPESPSDAEAWEVYSGTSEVCRDEHEIEDGTEYLYRVWVFDEPIRSDPSDAAATRPYVDDDQDGYADDENDCDDSNALSYPGALVLDCSATDWDCDGTWLGENAFCDSTAPAWLDGQCTTGGPPYPCAQEFGCDWKEVQDHTPCVLDTTPDNYDYDICVEGGCISPGACGDATCNSPGPHFPLPPAAGHADFSRAGDTEPVVTDNVTGLMWQGCAAGKSGSDCLTGGATGYTWEGALTYCDDVQWGGYDDWRLPDSHELQSIVDYGSIPAIDQSAFPATHTDYFWSSSSYAFNSSYAWVVGFGSGDVSIGVVDVDDWVGVNRVRCVRSGP
ncbi:MAG: DUF1566 domain-containing protein [Deltaproteobacteria bacterium]|nr:DUF1566 domain-containing protein [Deltaproteobacteria bacterium]